MSDQTILSQPVICPDLVSRLRDQFDVVQSQLAEGCISKVRDEKAQQRLTSERDAVLEQVVQLQARVRDLQMASHRMTSDHKTQLEDLSLKLQQQAARHADDLSLLTQDRDQLKRDLEVYQLRDSSATRVQLLEQRTCELDLHKAQLDGRVQELGAQAAQCRQLLNGAKTVIMAQKRQIGAMERTLSSAVEELGDMRNAVTTAMASKRNESGSSDLSHQISQLQRRLRQKEEDLSFNQHISGLEQREKQRYEEMRNMFQQLKQSLAAAPQK